MRKRLILAMALTMLMLSSCKKQPNEAEVASAASIAEEKEENTESNDEKFSD